MPSKGRTQSQPQLRDSYPWWEKLDDDNDVKDRYRDIALHLTNELCRLSMHLRMFAERRLSEVGAGQVPALRAAEAQRLGKRMMMVGSVLMGDSIRDDALARKCNEMSGVEGEDG